MTTKSIQIKSTMTTTTAITVQTATTDMASEKTTPIDSPTQITAKTTTKLVETTTPIENVEGIFFVISFYSSIIW